MDGGSFSDTPEWMRQLLDAPLPPEAPWLELAQDWHPITCPVQEEHGGGGSTSALAYCAGALSPATSDGEPCGAPGIPLLFLSSEEDSWCPLLDIQSWATSAHQEQHLQQQAPAQEVQNCSLADCSAASPFSGVPTSDTPASSDRHVAISPAAMARADVVKDAVDATPSLLAHHPPTAEEEGGSGACSSHGTVPLDSPGSIPRAPVIQRGTLLPEWKGRSAAMAATPEEEELQSFVSACFFSGMQGVTPGQHVGVSPTDVTPDTTRMYISEAGIKRRVCGSNSTQASKKLNAGLRIIEPQSSESPRGGRIPVGQFSRQNAHLKAQQVPGTEDTVKWRSKGSLEAMLQRAVTRATKRDWARPARGASVDAEQLKRRSALPIHPWSVLRVEPAGMHSQVTSLGSAAPLPPGVALTRSGVEVGPLGDHCVDRGTAAPTPGCSSFEWEGDEEETRDNEDDEGENVSVCDDRESNCGEGKMRRIVRERRRRSSIRQQVQRLQELLPSGASGDTRSDTVSIIGAAVEYISLLQGASCVGQ